MVGSAACRAHVRTALSRAPYEFTAADDPYAAAIELCRKPLAYRVVILCLHSTYREELSLIGMLKSRMRHIDVYVAQTDGRQAALAEAMRLGADGLLSDDGLHRIGTDPPPAPPRPSKPVEFQFEPDSKPAAPPEPTPEDDTAAGDAVLTAEELRALLQEQPTAPPSSGDGE